MEEQTSFRERSRAERARRISLQKKRRREARRRGLLILIALLMVWGISRIGKGENGRRAGASSTSAASSTESVSTTDVESSTNAVFETDLSIDEQFLTPNPYSRPGTKLENVDRIVVHYVGNPGTSAQANRNYFERLKNGEGRYASAHFVIGLEGEIIQCIPLTEISYASNDMNSRSISIECCHPEEDGKFSPETYDALVHLTADLCRAYNLGKDQVIRHYDVTGKICPKYFVEHEDAWETFLGDVERKLGK
ncbi:MAG: N-acetylmuramoyl-L-alanine amidase [Lachnospiraceae bacterium]|nr:N-acetylmuramoyl-L-alanine amidase [Lachnospiraceae bacterium]MBQ9594165.1 N-acetylmuramoyl-L-alanine amidase [Lachnospiraceae bacterium]